MIGARNEMLEVIGLLEKSRVLCRCDCGSTRILKVGHFNAGYAKSCGCHWRAPKGVERERIAYGNMIARCHNPKNKRFKDYGAIGIEVCNEWRQDFKRFIEDMGKCPDGFQIDRIDNAKGYFKENCRWVSPKENMANRSITMIYTVKGQKFKSANDAAKAFGVTSATIFAWCKGRVTAGRYYPPKPDCYFEPIYGRPSNDNTSQGDKNAADND